VARQIQRGGVIAGGSTVRLDGPYPVAKFVTGTWNLISRVKRWAAGSFIFCDAAAFREIGGFSKELFASEELDLSERLKRLGRATGRRLVILHEHPLVTSARKMHLYTPWEHFRFLAKTVLVGGRTLRSREECLTWYDGRR
jgi:GT2 family glycosyltransferase